MKHTARTNTRKRASSVPSRHAAAGQNGTALAPPDYGIDFVDRGQPLQRRAESDTENNTRLPDQLKAGLEQLSGFELSGTRVHTNSSKPAQLNALAYTHGQDIHVGPGQEQHLPHEGWHAVQQMQGRVNPTLQAHGVSINDDTGLEREADVMGAKALQMERAEQATTGSAHQEATSLQRGAETKGESEVPSEAIGASGEKVPLNFLSIGKHAVQRLEDYEHKFIGDEGSGGAKFRLPGGLEVSFGDMTAMAGDYFGSVPQIQKLAGKAGDGKTPGTRDEVEFVFYVKIRKSKNETDFGQKVRDAVDYRYYALAGTNVSHFTEPDRGDSGRSFDQLASARGVVPEDVAETYGIAKGTKVPVNNAGSYRTNHIEAIRAGAVAGAKGSSMDEAMLYEAFSSHFLTDAYASGHLRTPRAAVGQWWDSKVPMFWTNLKLWMAERIAKHMNDHSIAGALTVQQIYESSQETIEEAAAKMPALTFGDAISGAMHEIDNEQGVVAQIGSEVVKLVGDGQVIDDKKLDLVKDVPTAEKATAGVKVSLDEVKTAEKMGKTGSDPDTILPSLQLSDGLFRAEQLWPRALSSADPRQTNKALKWQRDDVEDLFTDTDMSKALVHFAHKKADELGSAITLEAPLKADKEVALRESVLDVLKSNKVENGESIVISAFREIINYTPSSATGETGGVFGFDEDDDAVTYYEQAKSKKALRTLTLEQRKRLVRMVLEGATVGDEDTMVADLLTSNTAHAPAVIRDVGWRWIWEDLSGGDLRRVVNDAGPAFWTTQTLAAKKREVKFLTGGRTSDISQRLIIVILRTCSGPREVRAIDDYVGSPGLDWDLSGSYQDEFDRLKK